MKQEPLKRRRPAARKRGQKQTLQAVVLSVLAVSVIALCLGSGQGCREKMYRWAASSRRRRCYPLLHLLSTPSRNLNRSLWWKPSGFPQQEIT